VPKIGMRLAGRDGLFAMRFGGSHGADDTPGGYPGQTAGAGLSRPQTATLSARQSTRLGWVSR
jgi:hypothetical protein